MYLRSTTRLPAVFGLCVALVAPVATAQQKSLPTVEFDDASVRDVLEFFRAGPGSGKARNILVDPKVDQEKKITLMLRDVPEGVAFAYAAELAGFDFRDERHALRVFPARSGKPVVKSFLKRGAPMMTRRANEIVLPMIDTEDTEIGIIVGDIASASREVDPRKKGLNIILGPGVDASKPVTLNLKDVPVSTVVRYAADQAGLAVRVDGHALVLVNRQKTR